VRGPYWTGREQCYRHAPDQYAAIHFHEDDIDDCRWPATHVLEIPAALKSGVYALMLGAGDAQENIPFFVVPPKGKATAKIAVLASTFTYTVYGNHARPEWFKDPAWQAAWRKQSKAWPGAYAHNPGDHIEYGLSTYNMHTDGSGISLASWHRPMLNLRIGYITYPYPDIRGSGLRHFPADSHLTAWLETTGHAFDIITDWELHHEGYDVLKDYAVVMTGTHPEYHTAEMLDALERYRDTGGKLMYLGGNGFYWKIALSPDKHGLIEIRRAEGGIRAWAAEPGEYYNQFDGEYGGLWRRNGRPPQKLVGVGFTAQGNFVGSHYRVASETRANPRVRWMLDGIESDLIGGFGLSGHGAAGFELDRVDYRLGTPANAVVIASSEDHPPEAPWVLVPEEQLTHITTVAGPTHKQLIRADMTYFDVPGGGAVFSTGSITFCGSLPVDGFNNTVSTLLGNVLRQFAGETAKV
jgi:N,N-dimethylformamidase